MWTKERFGFEGEYFSMPARAVLPKPYQKPHPPMWVAVSTPGTELDAADRGMGALGVNFTTFKQQEERVEEYRRRIRNCTPAGEFVNDQLASANFLYVHEETEKGLDTGGRMLRDVPVPGRSARHGQGGLPHQGLSLPRPARRLPPPGRRAPPLPASRPEGIAIGNPEQVTRELKKWEATGVDRINFILNAAETIPQEEVLESLRVFARDVMPHFA